MRYIYILIVLAMLAAGCHNSVTGSDIDYEEEEQTQQAEEKKYMEISGSRSIVYSRSEISGVSQRLD